VCAPVRVDDIIKIILIIIPAHYILNTNEK
jgi:hypothetical protein